MDHDAISKCRPWIENRTRVNPASLADAHTLANDGAGLDAGAGADGYIVANNCAGANTDLFAEFQVVANDCSRMDANRRWSGQEKFGGVGKPESRLRTLDNMLLR